MMKSSLVCGLQKCLSSGYPVNALSDFTVVVEDTNFKCHKIILRASEFFQGLFRSNMRECQENRVILHGMTADTFEAVLSTLYTGSGVTEDNFIDFWDATVQLQIGYLIDECERYVINTLSKDNYFFFYSQAKFHYSQKLISIILEFMQEHFDVIRNERFLELGADDVYKVIKSNNLRTFSEDSVVECILKWVKHSCRSDSCNNIETEDRKASTVKLISAVRLCLVSKSCLNELSMHTSLNCLSDASEMISEAMNYTVNVHERHDAWPETAIHRACDTLQHVMVFVDGRNVMVYKLNTEDVHEYTQLSDLQNVSITVFDNVLYMNNCHDLQMFTHEATWENVLRFPASRPHPSRRNLLLSHGMFIYCYDFSLQAIMRYTCANGFEKTWVICKTNVTPVDSIVRFKQFILMFSTEGSIVILQCFDTINGTSNLFSHNSIVGPTENMVSFTCKKDVFILQRNGHLWKINSPDSSFIDFTFIAALWDFDWKIFGAVIYQKQLFIFGNADGKVPNSFVWSVPHLKTFNNVKIVRIKSDTQCLRMVVSLSQ